MVSSDCRPIPFGTQMKVFILGTGATGGLLARRLQRGGHRVMCGDANPTRAASFAGNGIDVVRVNARRSDRVADAAGRCDLLVNCVPAKFNFTVLRAALRDHSQYLDRRAISRRIRLGAGRLDPASCYRTFFLENPAAPPIWGDPWRFSNFVFRP